MDSRETASELPVAETPEDVAALYTWANLDGAKYRDFSASRREYRAQIRYRAARALRERELLAQAAAEESAAVAERAAMSAEAAAQAQNSGDSEALRLHARRSAEAAARKAAAERVEAQRRAEAAARAEAASQREEREMTEAHASAQRQAKSYTESEARRRLLAGPQPRQALAGEIGDPYTSESGAGVGRASGVRGNGVRQALSSPASASGGNGAESYSEPGVPAAGSASVATAAGDLYGEDGPFRRPQGCRPDDASGMWAISGLASGTAVANVAERETAPLDKAVLSTTIDGVRSSYAGRGNSVQTAIGYAKERAAEEAVSPLGFVSSSTSPSGFAIGSDSYHWPYGSAARETKVPEENALPAWLYAPQSLPQRSRPAQVSLPLPGGDTLQDSRERVAARWFALKGVFSQTGPELPPLQAMTPGEVRSPLLLVFSLAGGVGKTSLVATLGRALSSHGERVLLTDTTSHGLLPFYFGARELRPGVMRTFSPPTGRSDAPIDMVSYDVAADSSGEGGRAALAEEIARSAQGNNRVVVDLSAGMGWLIRRMASLHPTVLVPIAPDMNSVISLQSVERFFQEISDEQGRTVLPFYVLNQFDAALPLHLDVREVFRRQLGERLLNFAVRRSPAVSEALAEGMTVVDYAPDSPVAKDYLDVAAWLQTISPPAKAGMVNLRWSER